MSTADEFLDQYQPAQSMNADAFLDQYSPQSQQPISTTADVAKSIGSNLATGALSVPLAFGNLGNSLVAGPQLLGRGVAEGMDKLIGIQPQPRGDLWQPFYDAGMATKDLGVDYQPQTAWGAAAAIPAQVAGSLATSKVIQTALPSIINPKPNKSIGFLSNNQGEPTATPLTAEDVRNLASQSYTDATSKGGILTPKVTNNFVDKVTQLLPQTDEAKIVFGQETPAQKLINGVQGLRDKPMTLQGAQEIDSGLSDMMQSEIDPRTGKLTAAGNNILRVQSALRNTIDNAQPQDIIGGKDGFDSWDTGKQLWATSARMNDVERIISRAQTSDNPIITLKSGFRSLYNNPVRMRGFTSEEANDIKNAMRTGIIGNALRFAGSKAVSTIVGGMGGGTGGAMMGYAISQPAAAFANTMQMNRANNVLNTIANRPVVQNAIGGNP